MNDPGLVAASLVLARRNAEAVAGFRAEEIEAVAREMVAAVDQSRNAYFDLVAATLVTANTSVAATTSCVPVGTTGEQA